MFNYFGLGKLVEQITPSDTGDHSKYNVIYVQTAGDLVLEYQNGVTTTLPVGNLTYHPIGGRNNDLLRIKSTGTSATGIFGIVTE